MFLIMSETYEETKKILRTRYGDKNQIIQAHLDYLENVKPIRIATPEALNTTYIECHRRVQALEHSEKMSTDMEGSSRLKYCEQGDILKLMEFLGEEVDGALTTQKIRGDAFSSASIPSTATLRVDSKTGSRSRKSRSAPDPFCAFCESLGHWAQDYVPPQVYLQQKQIYRANNSPDIYVRKQNKRQTTDFTYLQTARIWVMGPTGLTKLTSCVLDGGSQSSFVTKSIVDELKLEVVECRDLAIGAFESSPTPPRPHRLVRLSMKSIWTNSTARITGFESTHAFLPQPAVPHDVKMLAHTRKLQLADPKDHTEDMTLPIEIIIGGDHYWEVVKDSSPIRISPTVVLIPSKFGWILSGNRSGITVGSTIDLETLGIRENQDQQRTSKDSAILKAFEDSYFIEDQWRVVSLPRKEGVIPPTNRCNAERRFYNLEKRLQGNAHLKEIYYAQMMDYIAKGHVELVALEIQPYDELYLPHQFVKKEKRGKTKWRIVFDASAHEDNSPSLNDSLEMGPNLLPEVLSILL
ncbi:hypothetical protein ANN_24688 [Periplaneta americana]|uniref:Peptidase aspartic putative domain-containing protein n=1 Tax=Periplaneta americana TaxID=6978 RepID=A0ABQ8RZD2_PERAM|nr:hypothetical protein ANN_24688 [Periplaneta americana]